MIDNFGNVLSADLTEWPMSDMERLELYEKLERAEGRIVALEKQVILYFLSQSGEVNPV